MKGILTFFSIICILTINGFASDKPVEASFSQYFEVQPDVNNCNAGTLKQSVINEVLDKVNHIRSLHKLKPVTYEALGSAMSMEGCLNMVASGEGGHIDNPSTPCYTKAGGEARMKGNIEYGGAGNTAIGSIVGWLIDDHNADIEGQYKVGHRRAILNPFLTRFSFGKSYGKPKSGGSSDFHASLFLYQDFTDGNAVENQLDFIAYPYEYYPPEYVNKSFYLSFNALSSKTNLWNNQNVTYSGTTIEMKDESGNSVSVHSVKNDNEGWGSFPNNLSWKADGLADNVKYTVTIRNVNVGGTMKDFTYWFELTNINHTQPPTAPTPQTPENLAKYVKLNNSITWSLTPNTSRFHLQLAEDQNFSKIIIDKNNLSVNYYTPNELDYETTYYWRVASMNDAGKSGWSQVFSFTTAYPVPDRPYLAGPANNTVTNSTTPLLYWTSVPGAETYTLQISRDETFEGFSVRYTKSSMTDTFHVVPPSRLNNETDYWWRVKAVNSGGESSYTSSWKFHTGVPLPAPTLVGPADGTETDLTPTLSWNVVPGATTYNVQLADRIGFDQGYIVNELKWEDVNYTLPKDLLKSDKTYYWRVKANSESGSGPFSPVMSFTAKGGTSVEFANINSEKLMIFPNPVQGHATIRYNLTKNGFVKIQMLDLLGNEIAELVNRYCETGEYFDTINFSKFSIGNGIYLIKMSGDEGIYITKINLSK